LSLQTKRICRSWYSGPDPVSLIRELKNYCNKVLVFFYFDSTMTPFPGALAQW
jgi:hypothetical protein